MSEEPKFILKGLAETNIEGVLSIVSNVDNQTIPSSRQTYSELSSYIVSPGSKVSIYLLSEIQDCDYEFPSISDQKKCITSYVAASLSQKIANEDEYLLQSGLTVAQQELARQNSDHFFALKKGYEVITTDSHGDFFAGFATLVLAGAIIVIPNIFFYYDCVNQRFYTEREFNDLRINEDARTNFVAIPAFIINPSFKGTIFELGDETDRGPRWGGIQILLICEIISLCYQYEFWRLHNPNTLEQFRIFAPLNVAIENRNIRSFLSLELHNGLIRLTPNAFFQRNFFISHSRFFVHPGNHAFLGTNGDQNGSPGYDFAIYARMVNSGIVTAFSLHCTNPEDPSISYSLDRTEPENPLRSYSFSVAELNTPLRYYGHCQFLLEDAVFGVAYISLAMFYFQDAFRNVEYADYFIRDDIQRATDFRIPVPVMLTVFDTQLSLYNQLDDSIENEKEKGMILFKLHLLSMFINFRRQLEVDDRQIKVQIVTTLDSALKDLINRNTAPEATQENWFETLSGYLTRDFPGYHELIGINPRPDEYCMQLKKTTIELYSLQRMIFDSIIRDFENFVIDSNTVLKDFGSLFSFFDFASSITNVKIITTNLTVQQLLVPKDTGGIMYTPFANRRTLDRLYNNFRCGLQPSPILGPQKNTDFRSTPNVMNFVGHDINCLEDRPNRIPVQKLPNGSATIFLDCASSGFINRFSIIRKSHPAFIVYSPREKLVVAQIFEFEALSCNIRKLYSISFPATLTFTNNFDQFKLINCTPNIDISGTGDESHRFSNDISDLYSAESFIPLEIQRVEEVISVDESVRQPPLEQSPAVLRIESAEGQPPVVDSLTGDSTVENGDESGNRAEVNLESPQAPKNGNLIADDESEHGTQTQTSEAKDASEDTLKQSKGTEEEGDEIPPQEKHEKIYYQFFLAFIALAAGAVIGAIATIIWINLAHIAIQNTSVLHWSPVIVGVMIAALIPIVRSIMNCRRVQPNLAID